MTTTLAKSDDTGSEIQLHGWDDIQIEPAALYRLTARALKLYLYLVDRARSTGTAWPSRARMVADLNRTPGETWSEPTVTRALRELEIAGYIARYRRVGMTSLTVIYKSPPSRRITGDPTSDHGRSVESSSSNIVAEPITDRDPVIIAWERDTGQLVTAPVASALHDAVEQYSADSVMQAIREAVLRQGVGRVSWPYVAGILRNGLNRRRSVPTVSPASVSVPLMPSDDLPDELDEETRRRRLEALQSLSGANDDKTGS